MPFDFQIGLDGKRVRATFSGEMTHEDACVAIERFELTIPSSGTFEFHADLRDLTRYDAAARQAWTQVLNRHRERCSRIWIYGARPIIRMAAATVALIVRLPMEFSDRPYWDRSRASDAGDS